MNEYQQLVNSSQKKRISLTNSQIRSIKNMYVDIAKDLDNRLKVAKKGSLTERWLKDYKKQFQNDIKELNKVLERNIKNSMGESVNLPIDIQLSFFNMVDKQYNMDVSPRFSTMFTKIPNEVVAELISGEFYKDGKGLSKRIWFNQQKANADFDYIIQRGIAEKRSVYDIATDLSSYVNPEAEKTWDFKKIYPSVGNKKIEYNAFRLAVTSISHAYQLSMQRSCKANPFVEGIEWHTSNSHRGPCPTCQDRDGNIYEPDKLPLDHPIGVCHFTPVINRSLDSVAMQLRDWMNGGSDDMLDSWYKEYGTDFI